MTSIGDKGLKSVKRFGIATLTGFVAFLMIGPIGLTLMPATAVLLKLYP